MDKSGFTLEEQYGYGCDFALPLRWWPALGRLLGLFPRGANAVGLLPEATPRFWQHLARMRLYVARNKS